nr:hypothetical protein [Streptacidiphilus rugosus]
MVGADRDHVPESERTAGGAQGAAAVDLVGGEEARLDLVLGHGPGEHRGGQFGLGREDHLLGDTGQLTALLVCGPALGQVQGPVDHGAAEAGGVGEVDRDLADPDTAQ